MSKRTGMPKAEKIRILSNILYDAKAPFTLKEMEKLGSKQKVVLQSIKDVLQELVDDSLIHLEKIGISNYYWAFPSEAQALKKRKLESLEEDVTVKKAKLAENKKLLETLSVGRDQNEEYVSIHQNHLANLAKLKEIEKELLVYRNNDPEILKELSDMVDTAKNSVNRWTDNTWNCKSYMKKKLGTDPKECDKFLKINPDTFDYID
jgi:hypothetical protein